MAVVAAFYAALCFQILAQYGHDPTCLARIGDRVDTGRLVPNQNCVEQDSVGYDGQFYFFIALDPTLLTYDPTLAMDSVAYRYGRILYPLLAWLLAGGQEWLVPWSLLIVNVLAVLCCTAGAMGILQHFGASRWLSVAVALSPPLLIGTLADLAEPVSLACTIWGLLWFCRRQHIRATLVLSLSVFAREVGVVVPLVFSLAFLVARDWRRCLLYAVPGVVLAAWNAILWLRLGAFGVLSGPPNFGPPLGGMIYRARWLLGLQDAWHGEGLASTWQRQTELTVLILTAAIMFLGVIRFCSRPHPLSAQLFAQCLLMAFTTPEVWLDLYSYSRVMGPMFLFYGLVLLLPRAAKAVEGVAATADAPTWSGAANATRFQT
ncbi:MAG: hypothetical protein U0821_26625 [Chloroflexota bacterium]